MHSNHPSRFSRAWGASLRFCISDTLPGDLDTTHMQAALEIIARMPRFPQERRGGDRKKEGVRCKRGRKPHQKHKDNA